MQFVTKTCLACLLSLMAFPAFADGFGLPTQSTGLGVGDLTNFTGIRFDFSDRGVQRVSGLNVTLFIPNENNAANYAGVRFNLMGQRASTSTGLIISG